MSYFLGIIAVLCILAFIVAKPFFAFAWMMFGNAFIAASIAFVLGYIVGKSK
jgi:hypothetical protein